MAINNIVPRVDSEGKLGIQNKKWNEVNAVNINASTLTSQKVRASDLLTVNDQDLITAGNNIGISKNAQGQYEISSNALSSIPSASTIQAGVIEIATDAEATLGALNSVAVTPKQLKDNLKNKSTVYFKDDNLIVTSNRKVEKVQIYNLLGMLLKSYSGMNFNTQEQNAFQTNLNAKQVYIVNLSYENKAIESYKIVK